MQNYNSKFKILTIVASALLVLQFLPLPVSADYNQTAAVNYLKSRPLDEWGVMALASTSALGGVSLDFLKADPGAKPTDIEKRILAIVAAQQDPETFGQVNLIQKLTSNFNGTEINSSLASNLLNDDIFGLLALSAANKNLEIRKQLASFIKQNQNTDGGWSYTYKGADSDSNDTAMAIMALLSNGESSNSSPINSGFNYLAATKTATGYSFDATSGFGPDSASTSWVTSALTSANRAKPPEALSYLQNLQNSDGSFSWQDGSSGSALMTAYAVIALKPDFYPVRPAASGGGGGCNLNVRINADRTTILVGETAFLEAIGFVSATSWSLSDPTKAILFNSRVNTGKNTAEITGANPGSVMVSATADNCTTQITITITATTSSGTTPQFQVWIKGPSTTIFQGTLSFNNFSLTDSVGQTHSFTQPAAIGTVSEASRVNNFSYVIRNTSLGLFVECVANICPSGTTGWMYAVNGTKPNIGPAQYILSNGDTVIWFFGGSNDPVPAWPGSSNSSSASVNLTTNILPSSVANPPSVTLTASKTQINLGEAIALTWSSQNAQFVISSSPNSWAGTILSGTLNIQPAQTTTYSITVGACPAGFSWSGHMNTTLNPALPVCQSGTVNANGTVASASVTISVNQQPSIVFGIDTASINFGDLRASETSAARAVRLTNTGSANLRIAATLQSADSLYQQGLFLDGTIWSGYQTNLDANFAETVNLILQVPGNYQALGLRTGTLIFWATPR